jgi:hypothetical protein
MTCLMEELNEFSRDYTRPIEDTPTHLLFQNMPKSFCIGDISMFADKLESSNVAPETWFVYRALCFKSRALWNAGKYSKALTSLAVASEFWLSNLNDKNRLGFLI